MANNNSDRMVFKSYDFTAIIMFTLVSIAGFAVSAYMLRHSFHDDYSPIISIVCMIAVGIFIIKCDLSGYMQNRSKYRVLHLILIMALSILFCIIAFLASEIVWSMYTGDTLFSYRKYTSITCWYLLPSAIAVAYHPLAFSLLSNITKNSALQFVTKLVMIIIITNILCLGISHISDYASQSASCYSLPDVVTMDYSNSVICDTAMMNELLLIDCSILIVYRIICHLLFMRSKRKPTVLLETKV